MQKRLTNFIPFKSKEKSGVRNSGRFVCIYNPCQPHETSSGGDLVNYCPDLDLVIVTWSEVCLWIYSWWITKWWTSLPRENSVFDWLRSPPLLSLLTFDPLPLHRNLDLCYVHRLKLWTSNKLMCMFATRCRSHQESEVRRPYSITPSKERYIPILKYQWS